MTGDYAVPSGPVMVEYEIKKSRFIARADFAGSREDALAMLAQTKRDYPDARHHCWAYYIGNPHSPHLVAFSDDGEPNGTAGKPILNVLEHKNTGNIMLVVIRYFGGIKLGAGGLVRAYSHAAQLAMDGIETKMHITLQPCRVVGDFKLEQPLRHWLSVHQGELQSVEYGQRVIFNVQLPMGLNEALEAYVSAQGAELTWL